MLLTHKNFLKENTYNYLLQLKATACHYLGPQGRHVTQVGPLKDLIQDVEEERASLSYCNVSSRIWAQDILLVFGEPA